MEADQRQEVQGPVLRRSPLVLGPRARTSWSNGVRWCASQQGARARASLDENKTEAKGARIAALWSRAAQRASWPVAFLAASDPVACRSAGTSCTSSMRSACGLLAPILLAPRLYPCFEHLLCKCVMPTVKRKLSNSGVCTPALQWPRSWRAPRKESCICELARGGGRSNTSLLCWHNRRHTFCSSIKFSWRLPRMWTCRCAPHRPRKPCGKTASPLTGGPVAPG